MKVFTNRVLPEKVFQKLQDDGIIVTEWLGQRELTPDEFITYAQEADGIMLMAGMKINADILQQCKNLKVISLHSVGFDNVDIETATKLGIAIGHTPDVLSKATADAAFLLMLATSRKAFFHHKRALKGEWKSYGDTSELLGIDIEGKTLGIFGLGSIGYEMAKRSKNAFGMDILYHNRSTNEKAEKELGARKVSFEELLEQSDVISVHANLTPETKEVFNASAFAKMKPNAIFVNVARGGIHNEADLKAALDNKTIWGAGLDVTNPEPMAIDNPLLDMLNVSVLPHIGSAVKETRDAMMELMVGNLLAGLKGEQLPKCVNPEVYKKQ
ncbi:2-hydroxyacid dehydrogenase [Flavobacterium sp. AG291]|uniref:2-hydroxyacid dehydrogenase n=1 Tax=Flavobacterium sp. AG291 TaxID=2184000 RepID=UPI000E0CB6E6|nr:D-glycerate dehydrogenase [Flavobacterium sp. AG291]